MNEKVINQPVDGQRDLNLAVRVLWIELAFYLVQTIASSFWIRADQDQWKKSVGEADPKLVIMTIALLLALTVGLEVFLILKIKARRNWARIFYMLFSIFGSVYSFQHYSEVMVPFKFAAMVIHEGLNLFVLWLLFFSRASVLFKTKKAVEG